MFRAAIRSTPRALRQSSAVASTGRRFASTAPPDKRYTWKGTAARWGLAVGALYWYNTSPIFADELPSRLSPEPPQFSESDIKTVDAIVEEKRRQLDAKLKAKEEQASKQAVAAQNATPQETPSPQQTAVATPTDAEKSPEQLEEEAGQQGAFNPETGEINWDCPCLGGMAHGPCGEEFKAAFSCFVYSNEEPKGMDCIDKFQHMQDCFRKYPDVYGAEIADEEASEREADEAAAASPATSAVQANEAAGASATLAPKTEFTTEELKTGPTDAPKGALVGGSGLGKGSRQVSREELAGDERGLPTRSFDATSANKKGSK
ncbi:Mitochondrial intermembrane space import and assembly protein 40 [Cytospora mali]|uniref:Mitochondrial intermembrane space import and assembly protein 40 n=1 Tax=Cytospora mali TaxID=578113 RepID=A0A194UTH3_CYTMA|nr:Mitochondrial intermembrane space import and assembly protein 40 [Valsa mali var. pyri (nom. inval.)]